MEMAASDVLWILFVLSAKLSVDAELTCSYDGADGTKLVCRPSDDSDHVLKRGLVSDSNATHQIVLRECNIIDIELQAFENLPEVETIDLEVNRIQSLKPGVFNGLPKMYMLSLANNWLSDIPLGVFAELPTLRILNLNINRLASGLKRGVFDNVPSLYNLYLSDNSILGRELDPLLINRSNRIVTIIFAGNDMSNSPDNLLGTLRKLKQLQIEVCSLTEVPKFATAASLRMLVTLSISSNRISKIDDPNTFKNLEKLEILTLSSNGLESINENVFQGLKRLSDIRLDKNSLKTVPEKMFQNIGKLFTLNLSQNLIEFVPGNAFAGSTGLKYLDLSGNKFTFLAENIFTEQKKSGLTVLGIDFGRNPWQCACLIDVINEMKSLGMEYHILYDGKEQVCATTREFRCIRNREFNQFYVSLFNLGKAGYIL